ncbi:hypothetical protein TSAR_002558, partial [Trichomalopsis sarcophagae]
MIARKSEMRSRYSGQRTRKNFEKRRRQAIATEDFFLLLLRHCGHLSPGCSCDFQEIKGLRPRSMAKIIDVAFPRIPPKASCRSPSWSSRKSHFEAQKDSPIIE